MREGAWINAHTGDYEWITEHASWIKVEQNAKRIGFPEECHARIEPIPWDFNGEGRKAILMAVMQHGFIRMRGHGETSTFESTLPLIEMVKASQKFMADNFGPGMGCRFNDLAQGTSFESTYQDLKSAFELGMLREGTRGGLIIGPEA